MNNLNADLATMPRRRTYFRASEMPVVDKCPAAHWECTDPDLTRGVAGEAAQTGTRIHDLIADVINGERVDVENEPGQVRFGFFRALKFWDAAKGYFNHAEDAEVLTECAVENEVYHARVDVCSWSLSTKVLHVGDWKTGQVLRDYTAQLAAGALALCGVFGWKPERIFLWSFDVNEPFIEEPIEVTGADLEKMDKRWRKVLEKTRRDEAPALSTYRTGPHCEGCAAASRCPALHGQMRPFVALMRETDPKAIAEAQTPAEIEDSRVLISLMERWLTDYRAGLRNRVESEGGIQLPSGKWLVVAEQKKRKLDAAGVYSYAVGTRGLDPKDVMRAMSITTAELEKIIGEAAPPRGKGKLIKEWMEELEQIGVLTRSEFKTMREAKAPPQKEVE